ncbi:MAG: hypothetical protein PHN88_14725 [Ignavibacteria bacterium]|nr:hypothetical protein [Ignavibacteria bacterium]
MKNFEKLLGERLGKVEKNLTDCNFNMCGFLNCKDLFSSWFKAHEENIWGLINRKDVYIPLNLNYVIGGAIDFLIKIEFALKEEIERNKSSGIYNCSCETCTHARFFDMYQRRFEKTRSILDKKNAEYASGQDDKLYNFKRAAKISGESIEKALSGMMLKHEVSIWDIIEKKRHFTPEMIDEKFGDMINYLILLEAVLTEKIEAEPQPKKEEKPDFVCPERMANCRRYMNAANPCKGCCLFCTGGTAASQDHPFYDICTTCESHSNFTPKRLKNDY